MTRPGYRCHECPDVTRVARCCTKPLRDPTTRRLDPIPGADGCPVLRVAAWFWLAIDLGQRIEAGTVGMADLEWDVWTLATDAAAVLRSAAETEAWAASKRGKS